MFGDKTVNRLLEVSQYGFTLQHVGGVIVHVVVGRVVIRQREGRGCTVHVVEGVNRHTVHGVCSFGTMATHLLLVLNRLQVLDRCCKLVEVNLGGDNSCTVTPVRPCAGVAAGALEGANVHFVETFLE